MAVVLLLFSLFLISYIGSIQSINQKCGPYVLPTDDNPQLIYYQLINDSKTVQYMWSLRDTPTLYMSINDEVSRDCHTITAVNESVNWSTYPQYNSTKFTTGNNTFTIIFKQLIEFCDKNGKAYKSFDENKLNKTQIYRSYPLNDFDWSFNKDTNIASGTDPLGLKWTIKINVPTSAGRLTYFPKTLFTENSTTFDMTFENFTYNISSHSDGNNYGRLIFDVLFIHNGNGSIISHFSRDDEYTPSIFLTYNYKFKLNETQGYLQWKPISYLSPKRKSTKSEQINAVISTKQYDCTIPSSLGSALYNNTQYITQVYYVMGTEGDDNNYNPSYITWTVLLGYGVIPYDSISTVVIITIAVGLGVPLILIVLGGIYVFIKKKPWEKINNKGKGYTPVTNEDK